MVAGLLLWRLLSEVEWASSSCGGGSAGCQAGLRGLGSGGGLWQGQLPTASGPLLLPPLAVRAMSGPPSSLGWGRHMAVIGKCAVALSYFSLSAFSLSLTDTHAAKCYMYICLFISLYFVFQVLCIVYFITEAGHFDPAFLVSCILVFSWLGWLCLCFWFFSCPVLIVIVLCSSIFWFRFRSPHV